ncbi:MAG: aminotransferase class V-fold PLP-dependent enzyme [Desulfotomaculum sp.]|nr:aminotransferase class V-fold PLP-dependent enzyme [Desulfotomaculum sp.]
MRYVYFDNAATSWPKPPSVLQAVEHFLREVGASPGRAGHKRTVEANRMVDETRELLAKQFNIDDHEQISFTLNATDGLNTAIKGILKPGDHVITSSMEHNSVSRPLYILEKQGVQVTKVKCDCQGSICVKDIEKAVKPNTKLIVITHASNVTGTIMPIKEIGELAKKHNIYFLLDASQSAGIEDIDVKKYNISMMVFPGHKSLYGPQGTGGLYVSGGLPVQPLRQGGTGSKSDTPGQPEILPEKFESGTLNAVGIAGLRAGLRYIHQVGIDNIKEYEQQLTKRFLNGAREISELVIYGPRDAGKQLPVVSFEIKGLKAGDVGNILDEKYNIACRAGLHCAPDAHRTMGTFERKLVRFSFSYFNKPEEVDYALDCLKEITSELPKN